MGLLAFSVFTVPPLGPDIMDDDKPPSLAEEPSASPSPREEEGLCAIVPTYSYPDCQTCRREVRVLAAGAVMVPGDSLVSPGQTARLVVDRDKVAVYRQGRRAPVWKIRTRGSFPDTGAEMDPGGDFVVYEVEEGERRSVCTGFHTVWETHTGTPGAELAVEDDGTLVVKAPDWGTLWSSAWGRPHRSR
jgi:hypothetical protein